jgi:DNA invertase Pin-like site-specific DNA recombinase
MPSTTPAEGRGAQKSFGTSFGREMMLERQREGIAKAKTEGKYRGRKPTARARAAEIATLKADGVRPVDYCSSPRNR